MRRNAPVFVLLTLAALAGIAALLWFASSRGEPVDTTTAAVTEGMISRRVIVTGTLQPARTVEAGARVSGTIQSIDADFNARVRAGQVIAQLDPSIYQTQLAEANGRLSQAQAEYSRLRVAADDAQVKLARSKELAGKGVIPRAELETAELNARQTAAELKGAEAEITVARAAVTQAQVSLEHTIIRSPIDGLVVNRHVEVGQTLAASVQTPVLFSIANLGRMQLLAEVSEADVAGVRPGSKVTFQVEAIGPQEFEGTVTDVRLQPLLAQAVVTGGSNAPPAPRSSSAAALAPSSPSAPAGVTAQPGTASLPQPPSQKIPPPESATTPPAQGGQPSPAAQGATSPPSGSPPAASPSGVITYVATIDVDNAAGALTPGGTAIVMLNTGEREQAIRIPNAALAFEPPQDVVDAVGQSPLRLDRTDQEESRRKRAGARKAFVWKFENRQFVPVPIEVGLTDDAWTELVSGAVRPGDALVTTATIRR